MGAVRVSSFGIEVGDLARAGAFYTEALGLTVVFTIDNDHLEEIAVSDGAGGAQILLMRTKGTPPPGPEPKTGTVEPVWACEPLTGAVP